ncbi:hypothetical protein ABPG75_003541 [Micractinium tetrahymenae]
MRSRHKRPAASPLLLGLPFLLLLVLSCRPCRAQMNSPLAGQGLPRLETSKVYVSPYLDRLLKVDEENYRWETVLYFYLTWEDPYAFDTAKATGAPMLFNSSTTPCNLQCSTIVGNLFCCDNVYLPGLFFKNVYAFPQDRGSLNNIFFSVNNGSVMWESRVHGVFYQPMNFSHFPFDSFELLVEMRFYDIALTYDTTGVWGARHPGVELVPSAGGRKLYTYGRGDDSNNWAVTDFQVVRYKTELASWFDQFSDMRSAPGDPLPMAPSPDNTNRGLLQGVTDQRIGILITIERFWKPSLVNTVLPVVLVFMLGMFLFFTDESQLDIRLEGVIALFLALTAVQFVVSGTIPTSIYLVPTQQLILCTYIFLFLLAMESIAAFQIIMRQKKKQEAQRRKDAYLRYCKLRDAGRLKGGHNPPLSAADSLIAKEQLQVIRIGQAAGREGAGDADELGSKGSKEVSIVLSKDKAAEMLGEGPFGGVPADACASPTAAAVAAAAAAAAEEAQEQGCWGRFGFIRFWEAAQYGCRRIGTPWPGFCDVQRCPCSGAARKCGARPFNALQSCTLPCSWTTSRRQCWGWGIQSWQP